MPDRTPDEERAFVDDLLRRAQDDEARTLGWVRRVRYRTNDNGEQESLVLLTAFLTLERRDELLRQFREIGYTPTVVMKGDPDAPKRTVADA